MNEAAIPKTNSAEKAQLSPALRELTRITVDRSLAPDMRVRRFIDEVRDPYHFSVNGTDVRIGFAGSGSIDERLAGALSAAGVQGPGRA